MSYDIIYLIESGPALELIKAHIASTLRVHEQNKAIADELGIRVLRVIKPRRGMLETARAVLIGASA